MKSKETNQVILLAELTLLGVMLMLIIHTISNF